MASPKVASADDGPTGGGSITYVAGMSLDKDDISFGVLGVSPIKKPAGASPIVEPAAKIPVASK